MKQHSLSSCSSVSPSSGLSEAWSWDVLTSISSGGCFELRSSSMYDSMWSLSDVEKSGVESGILVSLMDKASDALDM